MNEYPPIAIKATKRMVSSSNFVLCHRTLGSAAHVRITGATSRTPIASPTHHTHQTETDDDQGTTPANARFSTPLVAVTPMASAAPNTMRPSTSRTLAREISKPTNLRSRKAARRGPRVLPEAIPAAASNGTSLIALLMNAPATHRAKFGSREATTPPPQCPLAARPPLPASWRRRRQSQLLRRTHRRTQASPARAGIGDRSRQTAPAARPKHLRQRPSHGGYGDDELSALKISYGRRRRFGSWAHCVRCYSIATMVRHSG